MEIFNFSLYFWLRETKKQAIDIDLLISFFYLLRTISIFSYSSQGSSPPLVFVSFLIHERFIFFYVLPTFFSLHSEHIILKSLLIIFILSWYIPEYKTIWKIFFLLYYIHELLIQLYIYWHHVWHWKTNQQFIYDNYFSISIYTCCQSISYREVISTYVTCFRWGRQSDSNILITYKKYTRQKYLLEMFLHIKVVLLTDESVNSPSVVHPILYFKNYV